MRTFLSTMEKLQNMCMTDTPKAAVHHTSDSQGGIMKTEASGALPRNRRQAEYCRSVWKAKDACHAESEITGGHRPFSVHCSVMTTQILTC